MLHTLQLSAAHHRERLYLLGAVWRWTTAQYESRVSSIGSAALQHDFEALPEQAQSDPLVRLATARLLAVGGDAEAAFGILSADPEWVPAHETAMRVVLGWQRAELLHALGRRDEAAALLHEHVTALLPLVTSLEHELTRLPLRAYTLALQGTLLGELGQREAAAGSLSAAEHAARYSRWRGWIDEYTAAQLLELVKGVRSTTLSPQG